MSFAVGFSVLVVFIFLTIHPTVVLSLLMLIIIGATAISPT
jgi:hypothetical protein